MQTIGPYRLLQALGTCQVGGVWSAIDTPGNHVTLAILNADAARDPGWRNAFAEAANRLGQAGRIPIVTGDFTVPTPWVASTARDGSVVAGVFAALGVAYQPLSPHLGSGAAPTTPEHPPVLSAPASDPLPSQPAPGQPGPVAGSRPVSPPAAGTPAPGKPAPGPPLSSPAVASAPVPVPRPVSPAVAATASVPPSAIAPREPAPAAPPEPPTAAAVYPPAVAPPAPPPYPPHPPPTMPQGPPPAVPPPVPHAGGPYRLRDDTPPHGFPAVAAPGKPQRRRAMLMVGILVLVVVVLGGGGAAIAITLRPDGGTVGTNPTTGPSGDGVSTPTPAAPAQPGVEPPEEGEWPADWATFEGGEPVVPMANLPGLGFDFQVPEGWACTNLANTEELVHYTCGPDGAGGQIGGDVIVRTCPDPCDSDRRVEMRRAEEAWGLQWVRDGGYRCWAETDTVDGEPRYGLVFVGYGRTSDEGRIDRQVVFRMTAPVDDADQIHKIANSVRDAVV